MTVKFEFVYIFKKSKVVFQLKEISLFGNNFKVTKIKIIQTFEKEKDVKIKGSV